MPYVVDVHWYGSNRHHVTVAQTAEIPHDTWECDYDSFDDKLHHHFSGEMWSRKVFATRSQARKAAREIASNGRPVTVEYVLGWNASQAYGQDIISELQARVAERGEEIARLEKELAGK